MNGTTVYALLSGLIESGSGGGGGSTNKQFINATNTTLTVSAGNTYVFNRNNPISELNVTLNNESGYTTNVNEYIIKFVPNANNININIVDNTEDTVLWHNEPVVLANKAYTLAISVIGSYKEAVLSYAE